MQGSPMPEDAEESKTDPAIAMVATSSKKLPDAASIAAAIGAEKKPGGFLSRLFGKKREPAPQAAWDDGVMVIQFRGANIALSLMPGPIPWGDLEGPCATAWWWDEAEAVMREHKYHFVIALVGGDIDPVERRLILTRVTSAIIRGSDAVGVYWAEGSLVQEPQSFLEQAEGATEDQVPLPLWVDVRVEENEDGTYRCFTTGMEPLGFLEMEVASSRIGAEELMTFIGDTACYMVNSRIQIADGETMG